VQSLRPRAWYYLSEREEAVVNRISKSRLGIAVVLVALALLVTACGKKSNSGSGGLTVSIASPTDGSSVSEPFTLKVDSSVPLGDPSTGEHHVHLCIDGASCDKTYKLVYGNSFDVTGLSAGKHTLEVSLRNADHSSAGPTDSVTITVTGGATSPSPSGGGYSPGGYGYGGGSYGGGG
jgi:hypothetical protein